MRIGLRGTSATTSPKHPVSIPATQICRGNISQTEGRAGTQTRRQGLLVSLKRNKTFGFLGYPRDFKGVMGVRKELPSSGAGNSRVGSRYSVLFKSKCVGFSIPCDQGDPRHGKK